MRRRISLYIADRPVDLDDESFILFNWAQEDLSNPTVVKNSYTQQITLKGTPANNAIFGDYFRVDRRLYTAEAGSGVGFNPSARTPFTIYNEMNEILQSGYVKLDQISASGRDVQYQVTLYGGLGSFFYALSYDSEGNRRTLADLDYLGTSEPDTELDFLINTDSVRAAWDHNQGETVESIWDVVNFAPCYNGIPSGNFSADKALAPTVTLGLLDTYTEDGKAYESNKGQTVIEFSQEYDEWAVKDLRSYLQRPVLSVRAFLKAVCNPSNNGGYEVDMGAIESSQDFPYQNLWMTLPMFTDQRPEKRSIEIDLSSIASSWGTSDEIGEYRITMSEQAPSNAVVTANVNFRLKMDVEKIGTSYPQRLWTQILRDGTTHQDTAIFIQAVAYMGSDPVGGSKVACISTVSNADGYLTPESIAEIAGYSPTFLEDDVFEPASRQDMFTLGSDNYYLQDHEISLEVSGAPADRIVIYMSSYFIYGTSYSDYHVQWSGYPIALNSPDRPIRDYYSALRSMAVIGTTQDTIAIELDTDIRSNARITKAVLLTTEYTPADYLLSFCKIFGLIFTYDNASRKVTVMRRNDFYKDEVVDLSEIIDTSQGVEIKPIAFDAKWYVFSLESDGGEISDRYSTLYGQEYGMQRVNTGYDFDANTTQLFDGAAFRSAVSVLESSKYFNTLILLSGERRPSVFQDRGHTYALYAPDGDSVDLDVPVVPSNAIVSYFNPANLGYDRPTAAKPQFHDRDGGQLDGSNVLLFRNGTVIYPGFHLSDDDPLMFTLNDGEPCWILTVPTGGLVVPVYSGYRFDSGLSVIDSLDFGLPRELYVPGLSYEEDKTIYVRAWQKYLADRYDVNTKVMTCKVDFRGMQVGQELLRRFWWYGGSLWVLNKISNYSMTTWDLAECEFIQVQDKDNYLNGQY